jgi:ankyrin repeat protein
VNRGNSQATSLGPVKLLFLTVFVGFALFVGYHNFVVVGGEEGLVGAAMAGNEEKVRAFLQRGVNVDAEVEDGTTALMAAAKNNDVSIIKLLLSAKANPLLADEGTRAFDLATNPECRTILEQAESQWKASHVGKKEY